MSEPFEESRSEEHSSAASGKTVEGPAINFDADEASEVLDNEGRTCIAVIFHLPCFNPQPSYRQGRARFPTVLLGDTQFKCDLLPPIPDYTFNLISESE